MFDDYPDVLNPNELMELLDIGKNSLYKLLNSGEIASFRIGRTHKIPKISVYEYIMKKSIRNKK